MREAKQRMELAEETADQQIADQEDDQDPMSAATVDNETIPAE